MKALVLLCVCLLVSCQAEMLTECPSAALLHPCKCSSQNFISINCGGIESTEKLAKSLSTGLQDPSEISQFIIGGSPITSLPSGAFKPVRSNEFIVAENANLSYVDEDAFAGTEDFIRVLSMYLNNLQGVDIFLAIVKMRGLVAAILRGNSLTTVPERTFAGMQELAHVHLSYNRISSIGREAFADCPKLGSVILSNNELRVLPGRILAIDTLPVSIGDSVTLILAFNQIEEIEPDALDGIEKRIDVILNGNQMQTLPREIFQPLLDEMLKKVGKDNFFFDGNPFVCDCRMQWLLDNRNYFKILNAIVCADTKKLLKEYSRRDLIPCSL